MNYFCLLKEFIRRATLVDHLDLTIHPHKIILQDPNLTKFLVQYWYNLSQKKINNFDHFNRRTIKSYSDYTSTYLYLLRYEQLRASLPAAFHI